MSITFAIIFFVCIIAFYFYAYIGKSDKNKEESPKEEPSKAVKVEAKKEKEPEEIDPICYELKDKLLKAIEDASRLSIRNHKLVYGDLSDVDGIRDNSSCRFMELIDFNNYQKFLGLVLEIKKILDLPNAKDIEKLINVANYYSWLGDIQLVLVIANEKKNMIEQYRAGYNEFVDKNGEINLKIFFKETGSTLLDIITNERYGISAYEYPGSVDDAATYLYCNIYKIEE